MKVAVIYESRTGNTARAAQMIGAALQDLENEVGVWPTDKVNLDFLTDADLVFLGTWTDGLIIAGHRPGGSAHLLAMPGIWNKPTVGFVTYAFRAGKVVDKLADVVTLLGGKWLGGRAFQRDDLPDGVAGFVIAAVDAVEGVEVSG